MYGLGPLDASAIACRKWYSSATNQAMATSPQALHHGGAFKSIYVFRHFMFLLHFHVHEHIHGQPYRKLRFKGLNQVIYIDIGGFQPNFELCAPPARVR